MSQGLKPTKSAPTGALAQRDDLVRKRDAAYRLYAEHTRERQLAERAMGSLAKRITAMDFSDDEGELDLEVAHATAEADYRKHLEKANSALDRVKTLEAEIEALYEREFGTFAEEANAATEVADTAIADLAVVYERAVKAWGAAVQAWAGPCRAARIDGVPPFPLARHVIADLFSGEVRAQPPRVEVTEPLGDNAELDETFTD